MFPTPTGMPGLRASDGPYMAQVDGPRRLLLVETDEPTRWTLSRVAGPIADLVVVNDFQSARVRLLEGSFDIVAANVRLQAYNGLHLVYLIKAAHLPTRAILYSDTIDPFVAQEARNAGAFCESMVRLMYGLPAYVNAALPPADRRDATVPDRRKTFRGGRRQSDVPISGLGARG
jgi:hypothetical protein